MFEHLFRKIRGTTLAVVGLALVSLVSLSACQEVKGPPLAPGQTLRVIVQPSQAPEPSAAPTAPPVLLYTNSNPLATKVGADEQAMFTVVGAAVHVTGLTTYHYVEPNGVPSTGLVGLIGPNNQSYHWGTKGVDGQGGIKNASWVATVDVMLEPGVYWVWDDDWTTWSSNSESGGAGMFWVYGYPAK